MFGLGKLAPQGHDPLWKIGRRLSFKTNADTCKRIFPIPHEQWLNRALTQTPVFIIEKRGMMYRKNYLSLMPFFMSVHGR